MLKHVLYTLIDAVLMGVAGPVTAGLGDGAFLAFLIGTGLLGLGLGGFGARQGFRAARAEADAGRWLRAGGRTLAALAALALAGFSLFAFVTVGGLMLADWSH